MHLRPVGGARSAVSSMAMSSVLPSGPLLRPSPLAGMHGHGSRFYCVPPSATPREQAAATPPSVDEASSSGRPGPGGLARTRRASRGARPEAASGPASLRGVRGVGPKNEALFKDLGLNTLDQLLDVYREKGTDGSRDFFQDRVGIKNKGHVRAIVDCLEELSSAPQHQNSTGMPVSLGPKVTMSVEGNISAGKTTFLQILKDAGIDTNLHVVPEPVDKWQNVGDGKVNLLLEFYNDPQRFAYTFQNYVFLTRMVQERESYSASRMCRLLERSIFSDRMVFVRAVHKSNFMSDTELAVYDSWFDPMLKTLPTLVPNGFIYLRANPDTCFRRMTKRSRNEEASVQLEYLQDLHAHHEDWLWSGGVKAFECVADAAFLTTPASSRGLINAAATLSTGAPMVPMRSSPNGSRASVLVPPVPAALRDSLYILDTNHSNKLLSSLHHIPALVIDCDDDVDVENDVEYKRHVGEQVRLYTDYVRVFTKAKATAELQQLNQPAFNGYFMRDDIGNFLYTTPGWHRLSHADQQIHLTNYDDTRDKVRTTAVSLKELQTSLAHSSTGSR
ncbi:hypothetical protein FOA52_010751 [Chlamydomonas sp. UWO 241]|nr:hypothetical protein FOA52_010751 [Chlamydomonas sp. UWO 241]